jgi:phosphoribosylformylglycinamidine synthase subunit PurQ / glutaminase
MRLAAEDAPPRPRIGIVVFPGSNDDRDTAWALHALGAEPVLVWHADDDLPPLDAIVLPGGFSYGDYLRCGALARLAPAMDGVRSLAADGAPVLGICNGFQILCEAGLLPGVLRPNASLEFVCREVVVRVERTDTAFTRRVAAGQRLTIPVKCGEGAWFADDELLARVRELDQVVLRYDGENPTGAVADVAGVCNAEGSVMGLMPHPEHAVDPLLGSGDGALLLAGLVDAASDRMLAAC